MTFSHHLQLQHNLNLSSKLTPKLTTIFDLSLFDLPPQGVRGRPGGQGPRGDPGPPGHQGPLGNL